MLLFFWSSQYILPSIAIVYVPRVADISSSHVTIINPELRAKLFEPDKTSVIKGTHYLNSRHSPLISLLPIFAYSIWPSDEDGAEPSTNALWESLQVTGINTMLMGGYRIGPIVG
jgi:hypothetical protein